MPPEIPSSSKLADYEEKLSQLLESIPHLNLSDEIFDESAHIYGCGGYGDVHKAKCRRHGNIDVAVKRLRVHIFPRDHQGAKSMIRELSIWASVKHPNVLPLLGYALSRTFPSLISPWMVRGTVRKYMDDHEGESMLYLAKGISSGLLYLHKQNIVHSDLKCENVLLSDTRQPLLADFGISRCVSSLQTTTTATSAKGSTRWMAVEFFVPSVEGEDVVVEHSKETDVWAFGMVLFELLSGAVPFSSFKTDVQVAMALLSGRTPSRPFSSEGNSEQNYVWSLCQACWERVPFFRPTMLILDRELESLGQISPSITTWMSSIDTRASRILPLDDTISPRQLVFHDLLKPRNSYLLVDFARPTFSPVTFDNQGCFITVPPGHLIQPATKPEIRAITIKCPQLYPFARDWAITVKPFDQRSTVTVGDVLMSVHEALQKPVTHLEWATLSENSEVTIEATSASSQRCQKYGPAFGEQNMKRCDFLRRETIFSGLKLAMDESGTIVKLNMEAFDTRKTFELRIWRQQPQERAHHVMLFPDVGLM
ncbi:kinase-like protein [Schizopora paradoxa]|uniref:Kinase-like protein n=1 Tax=Schizopora paradoxa TaxID=27342 RepID=A0A0H2RRC2_9AGAM|nr:kinase-like protein [Schizopora paradoxa]